jgi:hypothetical protein
MTHGMNRISASSLDNDGVRHDDHHATGGMGDARAFGGLCSGAILVFAVERVNLWRRMHVDQYVVDFRRSLYRADPLIPIMGILSAWGAVVFALNSGCEA